MAGRVCAKHEEWCPEGVCRWCEPPKYTTIFQTGWMPVPKPYPKLAPPDWIKSVRLEGDAFIYEMAWTEE